MWGFPRGACSDSMAILRLEGRYEGRDPVEGGLRCGAVARPGGDSAQTRRLLALGVIYDGRSDAARFAGVGLQIIRDWVLRFNAEGPESLKNRKAPGPPLQTERGAARGAGCDCGERTSDPWCGALAALRSGSMAQGAVCRWQRRQLGGSYAGWAMRSCPPVHATMPRTKLAAFKKLL